MGEFEYKIGDRVSFVQVKIEGLLGSINLYSKIGNITNIEDDIVSIKYRGKIYRSDVVNIRPYDKPSVLSYFNVNNGGIK